MPQRRAALSAPSSESIKASVLLRLVLPAALGGRPGGARVRRRRLPLPLRGPARDAAGRAGHRDKVKITFREKRDSLHHLVFWVWPLRRSGVSCEKIRKILSRFLQKNALTYWTCLLLDKKKRDQLWK